MIETMDNQAAKEPFAGLAVGIHVFQILIQIFPFDFADEFQKETIQFLPFGQIVFNRFKDVGTEGQFLIKDLFLNIRKRSQFGKTLQPIEIPQINMITKGMNGFKKPLELLPPLRGFQFLNKAVHLLIGFPVIFGQ
jgi:hypothetical protein